MKRRLLIAGIFALAPFESAAQEQPQRLVVHARNSNGATMEILTATTGGGYMRRTPDGQWLGRANLLGETYHFYDRAGKTIWIARPELQITGAARRELATVREPSGKLIGVITAQ
jgi:hypothetical protein